MDSLEVDVDVNEAYIGPVAPDMPAGAVLDAYAHWRIPAHVVAIVPAADRGKATVRVRVALEQKDARIVPNMGVTMREICGTRLRIGPIEAVDGTPVLDIKPVLAHGADA